MTSEIPLSFRFLFTEAHFYFREDVRPADFSVWSLVTSISIYLYGGVGARPKKDVRVM